MSRFPESDLRWMRQALALARRAEGMTRPNPPVGAVVVKNGRKIGQGWHKKAGGPHAEPPRVATTANICAVCLKFSFFDVPFPRLFLYSTGQASWLVRRSPSHPCDKPMALDRPPQTEIE